MLATDFVYDDIKLSDKGYIICDFDDKSGVEIVDVGSTITFNKIKRDSGRVYTLASATYDECVTTTFDICKNDCKFDNGHMELSTQEFREIMQWLNRREFLPFRIVDDRQTVCWYNASFNVDKIIVGGKIYGARLTMETDRPFGYDDKDSVNVTVGNNNSVINITNKSNEIGYLYPIVKITCNSSGNIRIENTLENCVTEIANCSNGEIIILNGETQTISTSKDSGHTNGKIHNDFNWEFPRLGVKMSRGQVVRSNYIRVNLPCQILFEYRPIVKDVP